MFKPSKIIEHPLHTPSYPHHANFDIGLIKLDGYADLNIYTPACLSEANQFFPGRLGTVTGWGVTVYANSTYADQLQWIHATVGSDEYCHEHDPLVFIIIYIL